MISANETHSTTTTTPPSKGQTLDVFSGYSQQAYLQNPNMPSQSPLQHIWIVTGPAGSGKTTVAKNLQAEMGLPFLEGDDFHPASNKEKMANGTPLTDADRWDWLISLRDAAVDILSKPVDPSSSSSSSTSSPSLSAWRQMQNTRNKSEASSRPSGVIMSCSALKLKYRDVIRVAEYYNPSLRIHFIYLKADEKTLMERVNGRASHYMKGNMVHSQFEALEDPSDEVDVLAVDVSAPPDVVQRKVSEVVAKKLAEYN